MVITGRFYTEDFEYWDILGFKDNIVNIYYSKDFEKTMEYTVYHDIKKDTWSGVVVERFGNEDRRRKLEQEELDKIKKFLKEEGY